MMCMTLHLPPEYLQEEMKLLMDGIAHKHGDYLKQFNDDDLMEWKDTNHVLDYVAEDL